MSDLPPLTALRSFEAVARLGSISQAASELHVTHSAISQQIKLLENLLGVRIGKGDWEGVGRERLFDDELLMVAAPDFNGGRLPRTPRRARSSPALPCAPPNPGRSGASAPAWRNRSTDC